MPADFFLCRHCKKGNIANKYLTIDETKNTAVTPVPKNPKH